MENLTPQQGVLYVEGFLAQIKLRHVGRVFNALHHLNRVIRMPVGPPSWPLEMLQKRVHDAALHDGALGTYEIDVPVEGEELPYRFALCVQKPFTEADELALLRDMQKKAGALSHALQGHGECLERTCGISQDPLDDLDNTLDKYRRSVA